MIRLDEYLVEEMSLSQSKEILMSLGKGWAECEGKNYGGLLEGMEGMRDLYEAAQEREMATGDDLEFWKEVWAIEINAYNTIFASMQQLFHG